MKKKILFVIPDLGGNGASKSLINLLGCMDYEKYEVDLLIFRRAGLFVNMIPNKVNVIEVNSPLKEYLFPVTKAIPSLVFKGNFQLALARMQLMLKSVKNLTPALYVQYEFERVVHKIKMFPSEYDVAIGYLDFFSNYFVAEKVNARIKIGWNHNDYTKLNPDTTLDNKYLKKLDYLISMSDRCKLILEQYYPSYKEKLRVMHNIIPENYTRELSEIGRGFEDEFEGIRILTVARLSEQKGLDLAIKACAILKKKGINLRWYIIGEGPIRPNLEQLIKNYGLEQEFVLLGEINNPYRFMKQCDIYVQPSLFEGLPLTISEVKIIQKPIIATDIMAFREQIQHKKNGLLVNLNSESIADGILTLIQSPRIMKSFISHLSSERIGNEEEIKKLYNLMEG